jgi:spermidine synthase/tetratricopeptide (TPR) repeat protein
MLWRLQMTATENPKTTNITGSLLIPCATVFISSFCIMVVELVAGRMIARFLGSSLYTWTSVIGVVLAGITIGNYLGGRVADRWPAKKVLASLFALAAGACVVTVILNNLTGEWKWLWQFSWPVRVFLHVTIVFLLPSVALGTISPVVAKNALDRGLPIGRTVGDIYAWGAAGSIAGTFAAGYYLIALMGTVAIIWAVAGAMMLMALLYGGSSMRVFKGAAAMLFCLIIVGNVPWGWAKSVGAATGLRESFDKTVRYKDETQYCYVAVVDLGREPEQLAFLQDKLTHSSIVVSKPDYLSYSYERIMAAITHRFADKASPANFLILGGGGYVLPRYLERNWPQSSVDVVEIDPGVTKAAMAAFGLQPTERMRTISLDARNYIDELVNDMDRSMDAPKYDFIYEDALNDYLVPFQLTTREFNEKLLRVLKDDGIYMIELIDVYNSGLFLGTFVNTLKESFPNVYILSEYDVAPQARNTFVVVASRRELNLANLSSEYPDLSALWYLTEEQIETVRQKSDGLVLTDDFAPVEHLMAPVVKASTVEAINLRKAFRAREVAKKAEELSKQGRLNDVLVQLEELVSLDPTVSVRGYQIMALIFRDTGRVEGALQIYQVGVDKNIGAAPSPDLAQFYLQYALLLSSTGVKDRAKGIYDLAERAYGQLVAKDPSYIDGYVQLGNIRAQNDDFARAIEYFSKAVERDPANLENNMNMLQAMEGAGQLDEALKSAQKVLNMYFSRKDTASAAKIQDYMRYLESQKATQPNK